MIILEVLLTRQGDKFPDSLIDRLITLLGWFTDENIEPWKDLIQRLYRLRCQIVHEANYDNVIIDDMLNSDMLVYNTLSNLILLNSREMDVEEIFRLTEQVKAQKLLKIPIKRPVKFHFTSRDTSSEAIRLKSRYTHWSW